MGKIKIFWYIARFSINNCSINNCTIVIIANWGWGLTRVWEPFVAPIVNNTCKQWMNMWTIFILDVWLIFFSWSTMLTMDASTFLCWGILISKTFRSVFNWERNKSSFSCAFLPNRFVSVSWYSYMLHYWFCYWCSLVLAFPIFPHWEQSIMTQRVW